MWMLAAVLWILHISCVSPGSHSKGHHLGKKDAEQATTTGEGHFGLDTVTSMDELLELLYPEYSLVQHCLRRKTQRSSSSFSSSPPLHSGEDDLWGHHRQVAVYKTDGIFDVILAEMQRTACGPREVCLEVSKEYPESTSHFYLPRCVAVHRCGGCCPNEAFYCTNTSHTHINKTLMELSPPRMERSVVMISFVNHTSCKCLPKKPLHTVIRRAAAEHLALCSPPDVPCAPGLLWDPTSCQCVPPDSSSFSERELEPLDSALLALCGPNKVLDESSCECVCRNGLTEHSCGQGWMLDQESCECQCEGQLAGGSCPPGQRWDPELCGCVCVADCPRSQPLNPSTCLCQCRESSQTCLLQGKKFNPTNCSCYRLPCRRPHRSCQAGFYYSHYVCQCIPNHIRADWG